MTKIEIAQQLHKLTHQDLRICLAMVEGMTTIMADAFKRGENIYLRGFGTFQIVTRKAKPARNITANTAVHIPARNTVKFKASQQLTIKQP